MDSILAALGLSKGATVAGLVGAVVSLRFLGNLNLWQGLLTVLMGTVTAAYVTPLVMHILSLTEKTEYSVAFLIGGFGMLSGSAVAKAIPEWISAAKGKILGGGQ